MKHVPPSPRTLFAAALLATGVSQAAPVEITGAGSYTQNFDSLANSGTSNTWVDDSTIVGWYSQRSGTGTTYAADSGTANAGNLYSYGAASATERALGTLGSGNAAAGNFAHGVLLWNNSGGSITINSLAYIGEQWRKSGVTTAQVVTLWYQVSGDPITSLTPSSNTGWTAIPAGDFASPVNSATATALDGNAIENNDLVSIDPNISIPAGSYVMIRWSDPDHSGSDHGLAIDDVSLGWVTSSMPGLALSATPTSFFENAGAAASTGTVSIPAALGTDLEVTLGSNDTSEATVPATVTITAGNTSATFPIDAIDDLFADGSQAVTLSASASGYISAQTGITVDNDTDAPISVSIVPGSFSEDAGTGAATGTVAVAEPVPADLTITLASNDTSEATVPASVTITTGNTSALFAVDAVDDNEVDGTRNVTITATATGYSQGSALIQVTDAGDTPPPPTLSPGAIAFTGFNADITDGLAFVALAPIDEDDVIHFTDNEWNGSEIGSGGAFNTGEGVITWMAPAGGLAAGSVVTLNNLASSTEFSASTGTVSRSGSFDLGGSAETVYAYQGSASFPTGFLAVIATHTGDSVSSMGLSSSHIIYLPGNVDIAAYTGSRSDKTTFAAYLNSLADTATNWVSQDGSGDQSIDLTEPDLPFATTAFTLSTGGGGYADWAIANAGGQTADLDFDTDGMANGVEFFMDAAAGFTANPGVVAGKVSWPNGGNLSTADYGTKFIVQTSTNLSGWTDVLVTDPNLSNTAGALEYTLPTGETKIFVRLVVTP